MMTNNVYSLVDQAATDLAAKVAAHLNDTADQLEKLSSGNYGLLVTSLRWHATRTASNEFLDDYSTHVVKHML